MLQENVPKVTKNYNNLNNNMRLDAPNTADKEIEDPTTLNNKWITSKIKKSTKTGCL